MSQEATLQLLCEGKSNVLQIRRGAVAGVHSVVVDCCREDLPRSQDDTDDDCINRLKRDVVNSTVHQSTDFVCQFSNCGYHDKLESKYILHARSHFDFEVAPDAVSDTVFKYSKGKYTCSKCPRSTTDWMSFREHIRHHIFETPYMCSKCMTLVSSVPALRIHSQKYHVGKQTDFVFSCGVREFSILLSMLLPEASVVRQPVDVSFKVPVNVITRISCTSVSPASHSISLLKLLLIDNQRLDELEELKSPGVNDDRCVQKLVPGKYEYSHGLYKCVACCYTTAREEAFACHAWKHIHGSWKSTCSHNTNNKLTTECAIVSGLICMLKRVALNKATGILTKNAASETKSQAFNEASVSLENHCSILSTENSKFAFPICRIHMISVFWLTVFFWIMGQLCHDIM